MWVQLCLYIFWNGMGEGGSEQKEWPEDPGRICVHMESKTAFIYVALSTVSHLMLLQGFSTSVTRELKFCLKLSELHEFVQDVVILQLLELGGYFANGSKTCTGNLVQKQQKPGWSW